VSTPCFDGRAFWDLALAAVCAGLTSVAMVCGGCSSGSVELVFDVPADEALVPATPTTVTLVTEIPGEARRSETHEVGDGALDLGEIPVADGVRLAVELRSASQRLVGYGRAAAAVRVLSDAVVEVPIKLRRPFAYLTGAPAALASFDSTVDADVAEFKGAIAVDRTPVVAVPTPDGAEIVSIAAAGNAGELSLVSTSVHQQLDRSPVQLQAPPTDAVVSADGVWVVVGHGGAGGGISVVGLSDARDGEAIVAFTPLGNVGAVATALDEDGGTLVIALLDRADSCGDPSSTVIVLTLGQALETAVEIAYERPLMDLAAVGADEPATDGALALFVADGCPGTIVRLDPAAPEERETIAEVSGLSVIAAHEGRVFGLGNRPPNPSARLGSRLVLAAVNVDGSDATEVELPEAEERAVTNDFSGQGQLAVQQIDADSIRGRDLAVVPGSEHVAVIQTASFNATEEGNFLGAPVIPAIMMESDEFLLVNTATGTLSQRVRTRCYLAWESDPFNPPFLDSWSCTQAPGQETTTTEFVPTSVAVLFGAR
jgi:hypothetical protein